MKKYFLFLSIIIFYCCTQNKPHDLKINIKVKDQHSYLNDHKRILFVEDHGNTIDSIELYSDTGDGCNSALLDYDSCFILVDCNGSYYSINKTSGKIKLIDWKWKQDYKNNFIGIYYYVAPNPIYYFKSDWEDVYKYKDPR